MQEIDPVSMPFSDRPVRPAISGAGEFVAARAAEDRSWAIAIEARDPDAALVLPLGSPEAFLLGCASFPASWLSRCPVLFSAQTLACAGPGAMPWFRLALPWPAPVSLRRTEKGCTLQVQCSPPSGATITVRGETHADSHAIGLFIPLHRDVPDSAAARSFLSFFAFIDALEPAFFGNPTQAHIKILKALAEARAHLRNLKQPKGFQVLQDTRTPRPAGFEAVWDEEKLLFLDGAAPDRPFSGDAPRLRLLGAGEISLGFPEDSKGLVILAYDSYGRPRSLSGGRQLGRRLFTLRPGERIDIEIP